MGRGRSASAEGMEGTSVVAHAGRIRRMRANSRKFDDQGRKGMIASQRSLHEAAFHPPLTHLRPTRPRTRVSSGGSHANARVPVPARPGLIRRSELQGRFPTRLTSPDHRKSRHGAGRNPPLQSGPASADSSDRPEPAGARARPVTACDPHGDRGIQQAAGLPLDSEGSASGMSYRPSISDERHPREPLQLRVDVRPFVERQPAADAPRLARRAVRDPRVGVQARARRVAPRPPAPLPAGDDPPLAGRVLAAAKGGGNTLLSFVCPSNPARPASITHICTSQAGQLLGRAVGHAELHPHAVLAGHHLRRRASPCSAACATASSEPSGCAGPLQRVERQPLLGPRRSGRGCGPGRAASRLPAAGSNQTASGTSATA